MTLLPAISDILPHRGTMCLIDQVSQYTPEATICLFTPSADAWYADAEGAMPAWFGLEIMAQAIAAHVSLTARQRGEPPKLGALLGSRDFSSQRASYPATIPLRITATLEYRDSSGLAAYACRIESEGREVSCAKLKVYEPEDFAQFIASGSPSP